MGLFRVRRWAVGCVSANSHKMFLSANVKKLLWGRVSLLVGGGVFVWGVGVFCDSVLFVFVVFWCKEVFVVVWLWVFLVGLSIATYIRFSSVPAAALGVFPSLFGLTPARSVPPEFVRCAVPDPSLAFHSLPFSGGRNHSPGRERLIETFLSRAYSLSWRSFSPP